MTKRCPRRRRQLNPWQLLRDSDQRGDILGFMTALAATGADVDYAAEFQRLLEMIKSRQQRDREGLLSDVLDNSLALVGWCLLRMNQHLVTCMEKSDKADKYHRHSQPPTIITETLLPKIVEVSRHLLEIELTRVSLQRQRELVRAKKIENDRSAKRPSLRFRGRQSRDMGVAAANGHADPIGNSEHRPPNAQRQTNNGKVENRLHPWMAVAQ